MNINARMSREQFLVGRSPMISPSLIRVTGMDIYQTFGAAEGIRPEKAGMKMTVLLKGNCMARTHGRVVPMVEDDILFVRGDADFSLEAVDGPSEFAVFAIDGQQGRAEMPPVVHHLHMAGGTAHQLLDTLIREIRKKQPRYEENCSHYLHLLLIELERRNCLSIWKLFGERQEEECELAQLYIDENYPEKITMGRLAEACGMDEHRLIQYFMRVYGCTPSAYQQEKRIIESCYLLVETQLCMGEIAERVGYASQSYFSQAFKKYIHMSPAQYRQKYAGKKRAIGKNRTPKKRHGAYPDPERADYRQMELFEYIG